MMDDYKSRFRDEPISIIGPTLLIIAAIGFIYLGTTKVMGSADITDSGPMLFYFAAVMLLIAVLITIIE